MRSQQNICILCRRLRPTSSRPTGLRRASSRADTFNASKLVLDLEAAGSEYVRTYEPKREGDEIDDAPHPPRSEAVKPLEGGSKMEGRPTFMSNLMRPSPWRATGADYLALALLGQPFRKPSQFNWQLRQVFIMNMIKPSVDFEDLLKLLRATAQAGYDAGSGEHPSAPSYIKLARAREAISKCGNLAELSRYLALMTNNERGAKSLSSDGAFAVEAIMRIRHAGGGSVVEILKLINALTQKLESKELGPSEALCDAGMYFAAKQLNLPALKRYIDIAWTRNYYCTPYRNNVAHVASRRALYVSNDSARKGLLRLLTGWENEGTPVENEKRKPCLASLKGTKYRAALYASYLTALGTFGASDALWYEWAHQPLTSRPMKKTNPKNAEAKSRHDLFINAFLIAGDLERALEVAKDSLQLTTSRDASSFWHPKVAAHQARKMEELKEKLRDAILVNYEMQEGMEDVLKELERQLGLVWFQDRKKLPEHYLVDGSAVPIQEVSGEEDLQVPAASVALDGV